MRSILARADAVSALAVVAVVAAAVALFPGCREPLSAPIAAASAEDAKPRAGGTVHFASFADIRSLDPAVASEAFGGSVIAQIFAGLVEYDAAGNVVPDIAARFELTGDGLAYRFFLREGVRFHDGDEVTADDVKRSIERALHPSTPNPFASFCENIEGYADYAAGKSESLRGVVVEGRYVVTIRLEKPDATFLPILAQYALRPVCKSGGARFDASFAPCGAGPLKLLPGGWERGRTLTLVRHDGYFQPGLPHIDGVTFSLVMPVATQRFKFERGELDAIKDLNQSDFVQFTTDSRWRDLGAFDSEKEIWGESMNVERAPFDNIEVRRAVAAVIDRTKYRKLKAGLMHEANQVIPRDVPLYDANFKGQETSYEAALVHMANAGFAYDPKTRTGGYPERIPYYAYPQSYPEYSGQVLQQVLATIGLRIELRLVNYPAYLALTRRRGRVALSPQGWQADYPDPSDFFEALFHSKSVADEDSNNTSFYKNPRVDELLDRAHSELDSRARGRLYGEANRIICDEAPWAFAYSTRRYEVHHPYLRGYRTHPVWSYFVRDAWLDRTPARPLALLGAASAAMGRVP